MLSRIQSLSVLGIDCFPIEVELNIGGGIPKFIIIGLGDTAVQEAKERVKLALKNSGLRKPGGRTICNLAPADVKKAGPGYDLPIAVGVLASSHQIDYTDEVKNSIFVAELALNGETRHVNGVLSIAMYAKEKGIKKVFLPACDAKEACLIEGVDIYPVKTLDELFRHLNGDTLIEKMEAQNLSDLTEEEDDELDFKYIKGQEHAKRALEVAAAGAHNLLFNGSPGSGKTLMARTFRTILPRLTLEESLEVTRIYSISDLLPSDKPLITKRPFRAVHHTASDVSIVGGGKIPKPGEISLAHRGVLFLDELAEFPSQVLEVMRQPMEDKVITINRAQGSLTFPVQFILLAAMNPCPCGYYNVPESDKDCVCAPSQIVRYQKKISGPLLDRIDLQVPISPVKFKKLTRQEHGESSASIRERVQKARDIQNERFKDLSISVNSEMAIREVKEFCKLPDEGMELLRVAMQKLNLSARGYHRVIKIARTIADLDGRKEVGTGHVAEALQYRGDGC